MRKADLLVNAVLLLFCTVSSPADANTDLDCNTYTVVETLDANQVKKIEEIQTQLEKNRSSVFSDSSQVEKMMHAGLNSMNFWTKKQTAALKNTGIGLYYGNKSIYGLKSKSNKQRYIKRKKLDGSYPEEPKPTACISWTYKHLKVAYEAVGLNDRWNEIEKAVRSKNSDGTFLMQELQKDGWEAVYWNFDLKKPISEADHHLHYASQVDKSGEYTGIRIDHKMVNFRPTDKENLDESGLKRLADVPFWVGIANGAHHVFLGHNLRVNEAHSLYNPDSNKNIEDRPLSEWGLDPPLNYLSGVIMVPPGTWKKN